MSWGNKILEILKHVTVKKEKVRGTLAFIVLQDCSSNLICPPAHKICSPPLLVNTPFVLPLPQLCTNTLKSIFPSCLCKQVLPTLLRQIQVWLVIPYFPPGFCGPEREAHTTPFIMCPTVSDYLVCLSHRASEITSFAQKGQYTLYSSVYKLMSQFFKNCVRLLLFFR